MAKPERHAHLRRLMAHGFSEKALREQEQEIQRYADQLMTRLREQGKLGQQPLNMVAWYNVSG
jgi:cytochrome P450